MLQSIKRSWLVLALLLAGGQSMFGFALLGPFNESWQTTTIGYDVSGISAGFGNQNGSADVGGPKNLGQGYRWNVPTVYYAEDASFTHYFGSNGIVEIDKAFSVFNSLSNVSSYSTNLAEWPYDTRRVNYAAEALSMIDLKSVTMSLLMEQLGLAQPDRFVWVLRGRITPTGATCPNFDYLVTERNYDPFTQNYSVYVNNTLYGYQIAELCSITPAPFGALLADAVEYTVDPTTANSAVAADALVEGGAYYTGLTRDDVGGLRYLYAATNVFPESGPAGSELFVTNQQQLLVTSNLATFDQQALTLDGATLAGIYPGLIVTSDTPFFSNVVTTNVTLVLTNSPFGTAGSAFFVLVTNFTTNVQQFFTHTFANPPVTNFTYTVLGSSNVIMTNLSYSQGFIQTQIVTVGPKPFGLPGQLVTNVQTTTVFTNMPNGSFYIIPANLCGGFTNMILQLVTVTTNFTPILFVPGTNNGTTIVSENTLTFFTNYTFVVNPVVCGAVTNNLREGIEKINFVRVDFDSLVGPGWGPVTNFYHQTFVTNGQAIVQTFRRIVRRPDILFSAADNVVVGANLFSINPIDRSAPNFNSSLVPGGAAGPFGPGTIEPGAGGGIGFTFNDVGPLFENESTPFVGEVHFLGGGTLLAPLFFDTNSVTVFRWGSYDGTTNAPILYPDTTSIASLESQIFFQITTPSPLTYSVSSPFNVTLQASGGSPPYIWPTNGLSLPAGLTLTTNGVLSGTMVGAATNINNTVSFEVEAEDAGERVTQAILTINIVP